MCVVNIICSDKGWVYDQFIDKFKKYSRHDIVRNSCMKYDVLYALPYYELSKNPQHPCSAWFSHQEVENKYLHNKFINVAKTVDVAICHSKKYASMLRDEYGLTSVTQIIPGVDTDKFRLRKITRKSNKKLVVGYIGRHYVSSGRKNPVLLDYIANMSFIDFRTTGGKLALRDVPAFYRELDVAISPALVEGGPLAIQEALASGVPVICFDGVGVAEEFSTGVLKAKDEVEFLHILKDMYDTNAHIDKWRKTDIMKDMRAQVENQTWQRFVKAHDDVWDMVLSDAWKTK